MKYFIFALVVFMSAPVWAAAPEKPATEATLQAVKSGIQQLQSELQTVNNNLAALNSTLQTLSSELHTYYGGVEYVLMAIVQAFYFGLGLALFYIFDLIM